MTTSLEKTIKEEEDITKGSPSYHRRSASSQQGLPGPPQRDIFQLCVALLTDATNLPMPIRIGVCDLMSTSVRLSDIRAARAPKAINETRSGAPGSQSHRAPDADHALANIDRAILYRLVCGLSGPLPPEDEESVIPTRDNMAATALPALSSQLKALDVLSFGGRDVIGFPGVFELLSDWTKTTWTELQALRRIPKGRMGDENVDEASQQTIKPADALYASQLLEQLSLREWSLQASLHLITSIIKFSSAKLDLRQLEYILAQVAFIFAGPSAPPVVDEAAVELHSSSTPASPRTRAVGSKSRSRSKTREARPLTEGYDYYGLQAPSPDSNTPSPSVTPTPKLGPKPSASLAEAAPIALTTLPPSSLPPASSSSATAAVEATKASTGPLLEDSDVRLVVRLLDALLRYGFMPFSSVDDVVKTLCAILGYPVVRTARQKQASKSEQAHSTADDWRGLASPIVGYILRSHCANAAIRAVRSMLALPEQNPAATPPPQDEDLVVLVGAVGFLRVALVLVAEDNLEKAAAAAATAASSSSGAKQQQQQADDALAPSLNLPLLLPALRGALRRQSDLLDLEVLYLVSDMLPVKQPSSGEKQATPLLGEKLDPSDWDALLDLTVVARRHVEGWKLRGSVPNPFGSDGQSSISPSDHAGVPPAVAAMLHVLTRLRLTAPVTSTAGPTPSSPLDASNSDAGLPWTPKLAALLLSLAPILPDSMVINLVNFYRAQHLCLPCTPEWIANIRSLLAAFFHRHEQAALDFGSLPAPQARRHLVSLLFDHVYEAVQDLPVQRSSLMLDIVIPLAQSALANEIDSEVENAIRKVLVEAAAAAGSQPASAAAETAGEEESDDERIFTEICQLLCKLSRAKPQSSPSALPHVSFLDPPGSHEHQSSTSSLSRVHSHSRSNSGVDSLTMPPPALGTGHAASSTPRQVRSALDLIAIFNRVAFSSPWALLPFSAAGHAKEDRLAWEAKARGCCIDIFKRLLDLLAPSQEKEPAPTPVRLAVLQWLIRIRTDRQHRVYLVRDLEDLVRPSATSLGRGPVPTPGSAAATDAAQSKASARGTGTAAPAGTKEREANTARQGRDQQRTQTVAERSMSRARDTSRDRGRAADRTGESPRGGTGAERDRSSSRTRASGNATGSSTTNASTGASATRKPPSEPLWRLPEEILFELPASSIRSDVVYTYMHDEADQSCGHAHSHSDFDDHKGKKPVPLPVSQYLATCITILAKEREWDLVSYLICHLPHQLANKHLFCGPKAQHQILELRTLLAKSILQQKLVPDVVLPDDIKKTDVYAVTYNTLTVLISYRTIFGRLQQDEIVEAFMTGLTKSQNTAQPCIRALTVAVYEMQKSVTRMLPSMLIKLSTVMSSTAMSVHILELIASIGHLPSCYANFTETDYRRIFGISLQYIRHHIQYQRAADADRQEQQSQPSSQLKEDFRASPASFALSQYVMMLAYYNISLWFMTLKTSDRPKHVADITRNLLLANEGESGDEKISDQTEVCFDFLARFTNSNAEPKPKKSFLNTVVMGAQQGIVKGTAAAKDADGKNRATKSWLIGKALLTITMLKKQGWAEVMVRRPSGTIAMLSKLENSPVSTLNKDETMLDDWSKVALPASLMMDRDPDLMKSPVRLAPYLPPSSVEGRRSFRQQAEARLRLGDHLRERRPLGPGHYGVASVRRPRPASFSGGFSPAIVASPRSLAEPNAYKYAVAGNQEGNVVEDEQGEERSSQVQAPADESEAIKEVMREVLSDPPLRAGALQGPDGEAAVKSTGLIKANESQTAKDQTASNNVDVDPSFLAIQLSSYPDVSSESPPLLLPNDAATERMIRAIDLTPVVDFHKLGVLYVGPGQTTEVEILGNQRGSPAYTRFLAGLGDLVTLRGQEDVYTGGLDRHNDEHGKYAYVWSDDISQIVYHTATMMPNRPITEDPNHSNKKALIGNDWVHVVFNEAGGGVEYGFGTIKSQFNFVNIVISPDSRGGANLGSVNPDDMTFCECESVQV